jgi:hypothetical protein
MRGLVIHVERTAMLQTFLFKTAGGQTVIIHCLPLTARKLSKELGLRLKAAQKLGLKIQHGK